MKTFLPRAAALLGLSLGSALGGCVHITNTYSGMPGASQPAQTVAQTASGRDCGCPGQTGPAYSDGAYGYPYPAYYPQPYPATPPSSDRYIYVPYGYPSQGGYYPRPGGSYSGGAGSGTGGNTGSGTGGGTGSSGSAPRPVESNPRRPDSGRDTETAYEPTVRGGEDGSTVGINPNLGGTVSTPRGPRAEAPHSEEVRPNLPVGGGTRTGVPVADAPERDTRPHTEAPAATGDRASAPHDVTVRPNIPAEPKTSIPVRDNKPATGVATDAGGRPNPDRNESRTPVRTNSSEPSKATTTNPAQGEKVSSAAGSATSQPRNTSGSAATTAPVNSGASAQPVTVGKAETAAPASSTGSQPRRDPAPAVKDAEKKSETVAPAAATSQERSGSRAGEGSERATSAPATSATAAPAAPATSAGSAVRSGGTSSQKSSDTVRAAEPVSRPKAAGGIDGFSPSAATTASPAGAGVSNGKPR